MDDRDISVIVFLLLIALMIFAALGGSCSTEMNTTLS